MPNEIAIYGGGGFARELAWLIQSHNQSNEIYRVMCFIDDNPAIWSTTLNNIPVISLEAAHQQFPKAKVVGGVGKPVAREVTVTRASAAGFEFETIIHPKVERSEWIDIGVGTVICAGSILTTNISIGRHVQINLNCTIGHDVVMGDFSTLAPGVHVSGCVHLGQRVYIGTGAAIINGTRENPIIIGDDAVIGAGACVTKSVSPGLTVVGVPAKPLQRA